jgi:type IV pilus assembly protein PilO
MAKNFTDLPGSVQAAILVAVAAAAAGGVFYYFVMPMKDQNDRLAADVAKLKAENDKNEAFKQQQVGYINLIKQLESQLETLRSIVPDEQDTDDFMKSVFADGTGTGTEIRTFIPGVPVTRDYYVEMPFTVRLDGTFYNLLNFFDRLSHEQRIMSVSGLALGTPQGGGMGSYNVSKSETVGANCVLTTYYNKPLNAMAPQGPNNRRR